MHEKPGAKPERYDESRQPAMKRRLGKNKYVVWSWGERERHRGGEEQGEGVEGDHGRMENGKRGVAIILQEIFAKSSVVSYCVVKIVFVNNQHSIA